jgi:DHA2 family lincomycin resistance protein-like MFS transporter
MATDTIRDDLPPDVPAMDAPPINPAADWAKSKLVINIMLVSTFVVMLNETAMNVAIPRLMEALSVPATDAQWLTAAFLLTMAVVIPVTGFLLQRVNTRPVFILAMSLFAAGTVAAAFAPNLGFLVGARVIQAAGTAVMMPLLMTTVMTLVPPNERGKMMGNISIVMSVAPAIGPAFAGLILAYLDWRWFFGIMTPIVLGALYLGYRKIVNVSTPRYAPLDILSVVLSAVAFGGIVYGLSGFGVETAEGQVSPWIPLGVGLVTMVVFVLRQLSLQKNDKALLDLRTLKVGNFTISMVMIAILMLGMFGTIILLPIYLSGVLELSTLYIGLLLMPGALLMGLLGPFVGRLYDKHGPTPLIVPAMVIVTAALWVMAFVIGVDTPWWLILAIHIGMSLGFAFLFGPLFTASLSSVPPQLYSHGSALVGSIQQVAGAAGVALFVAIMSSQSAGLIAAGADVKAGLAGGVHTAFIVGASITVLALIASIFVRKPPEQQGGWGGH